MSVLTTSYVKVNELRRRLMKGQKGQTMTEYALIMAAIAVVVYATYESLGTAINAKVAAVSAALS
jgi:Flp pilus assembly pilin Flp